MNRLFQVAFISYIGLLLFLLVDFGKSNDATSVHERPRRFLSFLNVSHFFWRINIKANMVPWTQFFAQGLGFRMNWDEPPDSFHSYHHVHRRSAYKRLEMLLDSNGVSGLHCIRRAICELDTLSNPRSIYFKILKIFFRRRSSFTDRWHNMTEANCYKSLESCPFSILEVSTYTDL